VEYAINAAFSVSAAACYHLNRQGQDDIKYILNPPHHPHSQMPIIKKRKKNVLFKCSHFKSLFFMLKSTSLFSNCRLSLCLQAHFKQRCHTVCDMSKYLLGKNAVPLGSGRGSDPLSPSVPCNAHTLTVQIDRQIDAFILLRFWVTLDGVLDWILNLLTTYTLMTHHDRSLSHTD
jgi:hypothetical protein